MEHVDESPLGKLQQQYWTTKQQVIKKLGKKEDEFVVLSDSELDAKLEVCFFNSNDFSFGSIEKKIPKDLKDPEFSITISWSRIIFKVQDLDPSNDLDCDFFHLIWSIWINDFFIWFSFSSSTPFSSARTICLKWSRCIRTSWLCCR